MDPDKVWQTKRVYRKATGIRKLTQVRKTREFVYTDRMNAKPRGILKLFPVLSCGSYSCVLTSSLLETSHTMYTHTHTMRVAGAQPYELYKLCSLNPEKACTYTDHESTQLCCG